MFFTACGGGNNKNNNNTPAVNISITQTLSVSIGGSGTLNVTRQNTDDFTLSVSPVSGSGCVKGGNNAVICTPTAAGTYTVTVTATADTTKRSTATLTVTTPVVVDIDITPTLNISVGETGTLSVATQNTDFTVSVSVSAFEKVNKKEQMAGLEPTSSIINPQYQSSRHHG